MDLNTIECINPSPSKADIEAWRPGDAWLAGGSWLFSEPQPHLRRLHDLQGFRWPALSITEAGLEIAATCTIAQLHGWEGAPADWWGSSVFRPACEALLGSFKVWNVATVGGNMCLALPAGPMTALAAAFEGECLIWGPNGGERRLPAAEFVLGERVTVLRPGELLRALTLPVDALRRRAAIRQISLSPLGRSGALLIGTLGVGGDLLLTVTASTRRPVHLRFEAPPDASRLSAALDRGIRPDLWHDDVHGRPDWRQHVTGVLAAAIIDELSEGAPR